MEQPAVITPGDELTPINAAEVILIESEEDGHAEIPEDETEDIKNELEAPLAKPEHINGLHVSCPSRANDEMEEDVKLLMCENVQKVTDMSKHMKEDVLFFEQEYISNNQSGNLKCEFRESTKPQHKEKIKSLKELKEPRCPRQTRPFWSIPVIYKSSLVKLLSGLYALVIVVLGLVFATANSLTAVERQHRYYLEIFLVYLYAVSLLVLLYFQTWLLRGVKIKNSYFETNIRVSIRQDGSIQKSPIASPAPHRAGNIIGDDERIENDRDTDEMSLASRHSQLVLPEDGGVAHVGEGINFYLRLGALAFAFGSVSLDGLHISSYFESPDQKTCVSDIFILENVMHLLFTFVQTFFLFKNHKLVIDKQKALVRFGMMHVIATNCCALIVTAISETAEDYRQENFIKKNITLTIGEPKSCYEAITMARSASSYLFPCTILYSIIAAGIIYTLYQYVGVKIQQKWPSHTSLTSSVPQGATGIDCDKANKGLFLGLLVAVLTLIATATFFVFENRLSDSATAVKVFHVTEIALTAVTGNGIVWGYRHLHVLKFLPSHFVSVDSVLLLVALAGSYMYMFFILISVFLSDELPGSIGILSVITIAMEIIEITLQIVFILDGLCRRAENDIQMSEKPGRSVVTFLLVCNIALWAISMFEIKKNQAVPIHENFYGILAFNIITHMCVPMLILFRFHSAICLSKIWYNAYQKEKQI